ncbi:MAG: hypothetical protein OEY59_04120 [Deltaproteobacteria bacterium]|nr:hypothetical protein [Deltaproteobacteria bacterium]
MSTNTARGLLILFFILSSNLVFGQIVTPSFDSSQLVELATASSWRSSPVLSVSQSRLKGELTDNSAALSDIQVDGQQVNIAILYKSFALEGSVNKSTSDLADSTSDAMILQRSTHRIKHEKISYRWGKSLAFGASAKTDIDTTTIQGTALGVSFRMMDYLFLSWGMEKMTDQDLSWGNQIAGVSVYSVEHFRLEYSKITSPDAVLGSLSHDGYSQNNLSLEFKLGNFIIIMKNETITHSQKGEVKTDLAGFGFMPQSGLAASINYQKTTQENVFNGSGYRFSLAYNF